MAVRGGSDTKGEVWYTGTLGECDGELAFAELTETDKAKTANIISNPTNYAVIVNGTMLQYWEEESIGDSAAFVDDVAEQNLAVAVGYDDQGFEGQVSVKCPTDISGTVEVTVARK